MKKTAAPPKFSWLYGDKRRLAKGFDRILLYEFDVLEEHRKFALSSFMSRSHALEQRIDREIKGMTDEDRAEYFDHMHEEYVEISETFPRLQWYAQFLIVYSTFEHALNYLCGVVQRRSMFNLSFKDLEGQGIVRARNYLAKVASVKQPFTSAKWNRAILLGDIRNAIAHRNGEIPFEPKNPKSLSARVSKVQHLVLKQHIEDAPEAQILLSDEFIKEAIADLRQVITDVCNYPLYLHEAS